MFAVFTDQYTKEVATYVPFCEGLMYDCLTRDASARGCMQYTVISLV